jgi:hypothetical protein
LQLLSKTDIIAFSHTGHLGGEGPEIDGFECVVCTARPYKKKSGGVAVYAKVGMNVCMVKDSPEYGMAWLKIAATHKPIYVCACYMPWLDSRYFLLEGGDLCLERHWQVLRSDVSKFGHLGEVLIMGDLNARTGNLDDRLDAQYMHEWGMMQDDGVPVPSDVVDVQAQASRVGARRNRDSGKNEHGRQLIDMCHDLGLLILNGRMPGDPQGEFTYFRGGSNEDCHSAIDYYVASPGLVFTNGVVHEASYLSVMCNEHVPLRAGGKRFDHLPVSLTLATVCQDPGKKSEGKKSGSKKRDGSVVYKWNKANMDAYNDILMGDVIVNSYLQQMYVKDADVDNMVFNFNSALDHALLRLDSEAGNVISRQEDSPPHTARPCNRWYDEGCKAARAAYVAADLQLGVTSPEAKAAHHAYRRTVRAARRAWESQQRTGFMHDIRREPKRFWRSFGQSSKKGSHFDVNQWSIYFRDLFKTNGSGEQSGVVDGEVRDRMFPMPCRERVDKAVCLNGDFTVAEILGALHSAASGKAPGVDGLPMEFLKYAYIEIEVGNKTAKKYILADHITHLFNAVMKLGYPSSWAKGAIAPVPKSKGSLDNQDDYRGITVGIALSKLYSMVLLHRMDRWAEANNMRARGQAGFRHGRGTPDNAVVLNHIIDKYRKQGKAVYAGFIDFRKAYDCIKRPLLWECLQSLGVHGCFLDSLRSMYENVQMCVRVDGNVGECFGSEIGLKQGDPLSPLLFGLFIDRLEKLFDDMLGAETGVKLKDVWLKVLLYADDLVLLAETPQELQLMMDKLHLFCQYNDMTVNTKKSECVVFNKSVLTDQRDVTVTYDGDKMVFRSRFVYLGMLFEENEGSKNAQDRLLVKGRGAMYAMLRRCSELGIDNVGIKCRLFDALVRPVLCYGCEVWGPSILAHGVTVAKSGFREKLECLHRDFLRQCLGVRKSVPDLALMVELRRDPLVMCIVEQILQFWNKIQCRRDGDLVKMAVQASSMGRVGWAKNLQKFLARYGVSLLDHCDRHPIDVKLVMGIIREKWQHELCAKYSPNIHVVDGTFQCSLRVRSVPMAVSVGFKNITYLKWFADTTCDIKTTFWYNLHRKVQIRDVACFRLGSHWLNIEMQRFLSGTVPRNERTCPFCVESDSIEDELHVLTCPLYDDIFHYFGAWVGTYDFEDEDDGMNKCMNNYHDHGLSLAFWQNLANVLSKCKKRRGEYLCNGINMN